MEFWNCAWIESGFSHLLQPPGQASHVITRSKKPKNVRKCFYKHARRPIKAKCRHYLNEYNSAYKRGIYKLLTIIIHPLLRFQAVALLFLVSLSSAITIHASPRKGIAPTSFSTHSIFPIAPQPSRQFHTPEVCQTSSYAHTCTQQTIDDRTEVHMSSQPLFACC